MVNVSSSSPCSLDGVCVVSSTLPHPTRFSAGRGSDLEVARSLLTVTPAAVVPVITMPSDSGHWRRSLHVDVSLVASIQLRN